MENRYAQLTNEQVSKRFKSQFELVNHAIRLAGHMIHSGHAPGPGSADNIVNEVLTDIKLGRDFYDLEDDEEEDAEEEVVYRNTQVEEAAPVKKSRVRAALKK